MSDRPPSEQDLPDLELSAYELLERLGEGGMGVVFRAHDKRLERDVAIKVLPAERERDPERLVRFEREAKALAALNHPNIAAIYDVGESGETPYLVMELVEGRSLDRLIPRGGLGLAQFFELATPLADALAAAHDKGVTHRDLKPSNVMVTGDGRVKVLDFGLAKLRDTGGQEDETRTLPDSITGEGKIVGTIAYMSPEQAEGRPVDHRSDIFSLGVILYEMVTGRRPFSGDSTLSTLTAILRDTPDSVTELRQDLPRHLSRIIGHCLQKQPQRRYQSARDVVNELTELARETESGEAIEPVPGSGHRPRSPLPWIVAGVAVAATAAVLLLRDSAPTSEEPEALPAAVAFAERTRLTRAPGLETDAAWSPDGRFVAYTAEGDEGLDIFLQPIDGGEPIAAVSDPADDAQPSWSPDGSRLAFVSARARDGHLGSGVGFGPISQLISAHGGDLYIQPAFGGNTVRLVEDAYYPSWSPDGSRIAFMSPRGGPWGIWIIEVDGGEPTELTALSGGSYHPAWSPDGRWIAVAEQPGPESTVGVRVIAADESAATFLDLGVRWSFRPSWSPDGRWLYFSVEEVDSTEIWRAPFSADPEPALGAPEPVIAGQGWATSVDVAHDGRLVFSSMLIDDDVWEIDVTSLSTHQVTRETGVEDYPHVSPDGTSLLAVSNRSGQMELWTFDLDGRAQASIGPVLGVDFGGRWSPDGASVAYSRATEAGPVLTVQRVGELTHQPMDQLGFGAAWSPDGQSLAYSWADRGEPPNVWVYSIEDGVSRRVTESLSIDTFPSYSSDGRWIAFSREFQAGDRELWIRSTGTGDERALISGGDEVSHPRFSRTEPDLLLFLRKHQSLWTLDISSGEERKLLELSGKYRKLDYPSWGPRSDKIYYKSWHVRGDLFVAGPASGLTD